MNVRELIAALQKLPPTMDVCIWDHDEDDWLPVVEALNEDGVIHIALLTRPSGAKPVHAFGSCGGECWLCRDEP